MAALDTARDHLERIVAEGETMLARHKEALAQMQAEAEAEAKRVPTLQEVRDMLARIPA